MSDLVKRLTEGETRVVATRVSDAAELRERIDRGYVLVKFTETKGGTELGFEPELDQCSLDNADFSTGDGQVTLVGNLKLDYVPVKLIATLDLKTLEGRGKLELRQAN